MSKSNNVVPYSELDEFGRATLPDDLLDAMSMEPGSVDAAGVNAGFCSQTSNGNCTNSYDCSGSVNHECTNTGDCYPAANTTCPGGTTEPGPGGS